MLYSIEGSNDEVFLILYNFVLESPPAWMAYVQSAVIFGLMGIAYVQSTRQRTGFMPLFGAMAGIFLVDVFAYLPFFFYIRRRGRVGAAADAAD